MLLSDELLATNHAKARMDTYPFYSNIGNTFTNTNWTTLNMLEVHFGLTCATSYKNGWNKGDQIIIGVDKNNKDIRNPDITSFFDKFGMTEEILAKHGQEAPLTQNRGSYPINGLFATQAIQHNQCGCLSGLDAIGDHRCLWIDIPESWLFGSTMLAIIPPKQDDLKWKTHGNLDVMSSVIAGEAVHA